MQDKLARCSRSSTTFRDPAPGHSSGRPFPGDGGEPITDTLPATDALSAAEQRNYRLLIGGELSPAASGASFPAYNPSTGTVITEVPRAGKDDVARAVSAAQAAHPGWEALGIRGRRSYFHALAEAVERHREELALLDTLNAGNPLKAMRSDIDHALGQLRDWPALALSLTGETMPVSSGNLHYTVHKPYGVVGRIVPFNHPALFAIAVAAPLMAGNTVVLKAADQTPLSALYLGEIAREVLPAGVINILSGGPEAGDAIVTHEAVRRIAFTGSGEVGRLIQQRAAESRVKHVSLELGGKNPLIVFPDANLDGVVEGAVNGMNFRGCQGQSCGSTSRLFLHANVRDEVVERMKSQMEQLVVGPAWEEGVDMGPLVGRRQYDRVMAYIASGKEEGARLVTGGGRPERVGDDGFFVAPTMFGDVDMGMRIAREEVFGPLVSVLTWTDYDDMLRQANMVEYGLTASIWTDDLNLAHRTAARLEAGYVWINDSGRHYWGMPFGGTKNSGLGREESMEELLSYVETQAVNVKLRDVEV